MRPRPDAAENARPGELRDRFADASMRPRPDAAENPRLHDDGGREWRSGFNEAAARCRGKLDFGGAESVSGIPLQ